MQIGTTIVLPYTFPGSEDQLQNKLNTMKKKNSKNTNKSDQNGQLNKHENQECQDYTPYSLVIFIECLKIVISTRFIFLEKEITWGVKAQHSVGMIPANINQIGI